jgi:hypothetical protein
MLSTEAIKTPREKANELLDRIAAEGLPRSYRRILVTEGIRRQRLEVAI